MLYSESELLTMKWMCELSLEIDMEKVIMSLMHVKLGATGAQSKRWLNPYGVGLWKASLGLRKIFTGFPSFYFLSSSFFFTTSFFHFIRSSHQVGLLIEI